MISGYVGTGAGDTNGKYAGRPRQTRAGLPRAKPAPFTNIDSPDLHVSDT